MFTDKNFNFTRKNAHLIFFKYIVSFCFNKLEKYGVTFWFRFYFFPPISYGLCSN